jgi:hypothetical protein
MVNPDTEGISGKTKAAKVQQEKLNSDTKETCKIQDEKWA